MTKATHLGHAKPGSRMLKRGWLINTVPNPPKPAEKPAEKSTKKEGE